MRCDLCPIGETLSFDDVCVEMDGPLGITHKDGMGGCRHPYNWAKKRIDEYCDYLGQIGEEMGRMYDEEHFGNEKDLEGEISHKSVFLLPI